MALSRRSFAASVINKWGTAYAAGQARDPVWKLTGTVPEEVELLRTRGFHAPAWLGDDAGGGSTLKVEQISPTRDSWRMAGVELNQDSLKGGITWDDFFVVRRGWQAGL